MKNPGGGNHRNLIKPVEMDENWHFLAFPGSQSRFRARGAPEAWAGGPPLPAYTSMELPRDPNPLWTSSFLILFDRELPCDPSPLSNLVSLYFLIASYLAIKTPDKTSSFLVFVITGFRRELAI